MDKYLHKNMILLTRYVWKICHLSMSHVWTIIKIKNLIKNKIKIKIMIIKFKIQMKNLPKTS
jgi:hypothetical protein